MASVLPESSLRTAQIKHWTPDSFSMLRASLKGNHLKQNHKYCQLWIDGDLWMSDTRDEMVANMPVARAKGNVLIVGLGLGMALHRVLQNKDVAHVDVIEKNSDVAQLVWPYVGVTDPRANLILQDAKKFPTKTPLKRYDFIWLDIWLSNPEPREVTALRKLYRPFLKRGGFMGQWEGN